MAHLQVWYQQSFHCYGRGANCKKRNSAVLALRLFKGNKLLITILCLSVCHRVENKRRGEFVFVFEYYAMEV
jgi:hypothetical protein